MRRISDIKGEEAIDIIADTIEPLSAIMADKEMKDILVNKKLKDDGNAYTKAEVVSMVIKKHKHEVIQVLSILDGVSYDEYLNSVTIFTLPMAVLEVLNDPEISKLFTSQVQSLKTPSAPVTEITEVSRK